MKRRLYARTLLLIMILQLLSGVPAWALTGGPSQPEFQAFEPIGTTEMVNLPDGGFTYNIPLMDIGGYPLNLSYHSEITADMEASCVGLGWTINPGVINRNVRALPDDFNGKEDAVKKEFNMKENFTVGSTFAASLELYGSDVLKGVGKGTGMSLGLNMGMFYNTYWGIGYEFGLSPSLKAGNKGSGYLTAGFGTSINSQSGANFNPSLNYSRKMREKESMDSESGLVNTKSSGLSASLATTINSRAGLKALNVSAGSFYKNKEANVSDQVSTSGSFNFAGPTYTSEFTMPQVNTSFSVNIKPVGFEAFGSNVAMDFSGYFSKQFLATNSGSKWAYGMLYAHNGYNNESALLDFNREKDGAFYGYSVNLPIVNPGYDVLAVNGQGIGGSFQLKRGDVPVFFDAKSYAGGAGESLGFELGTGNTAHGGVDIKFNFTNSESKKWTSGNKVLDRYNFVSGAAEGYEPAYYKAAGEMAVESDLAYYNNTGKDLPVTAILDEGAGGKFDIQTLPGISNVAVPAGPVSREERERRNQVISYLTAAEASNAGLEKNILSYPLNDFTNPPDPLQRITGDLKAHHISQVEAVQPDGMRYVYGIPAYNLTQREVTFSVSPSLGVQCDTGTVAYIPGKDNTPQNERGQEHYFNAVTTPAYAHTYLLTTILGKDYEDRTGNGPTEDDFGSYTRVNYARVEDPKGNTIYHWRVPFRLHRANYNPGFYSKSHDDKGTYIYGQKELWYVHSLESKTMVAEFHYSDRLDGYGVRGENGGPAAHNMNKKLDKIVLYAKPDKAKNGATATPIKTVYFTYDYQLCPGTDNSLAPNKGKLTLRSVYFTYGHSQKGKLSEYRFSYKNEGNKYSSRDYDRWGNYKPNANVAQLKCQNPAPQDPLGNDEFPYAEQDQAKADAAAGTWSLNHIELPSGGTINVDYQAKHYAYVQDRPAMQMMNIVGIDGIGNAYNKLYGFSNGKFTGANLKVYFKLKTPVSKAQLKRDYLKDIANGQYLYLKCYVKMNSGPSQNERWEYVSLYCQITDFDVTGSGNEGYVVLKPLPSIDDHLNPKNLASNNINPITKYALQYMSENLPEIAHDQQPITNAKWLDIDLIKPLASMGKQFVQLVHGFNNVMIARGYAREIALDRSWVRLYEPNGMKFGGGSMVSKIVIEDNWGKMTGDPNADFRYGQEYDYTTEATLSDGRKRTISSGVASYEPLIGGDENPFRLPVVVTQERKFAVDNVHYVEEPFGEVFMPAPQVVFSEVKVRNLQHAGVTRTATGHTVMKYYTAKDFPVKTLRTNLQKMPRRIKPIFSLFKIKMKEHMNAAQGYLIETNNMHGQPESSLVFDENGTQLSGVHYHYKTKAPGELDNEVDVIHADGSVKKGLLGSHYSLAGDARHSKSSTVSGGVAFNVDGYMAGVIPVVIPLPWPDYEASEEQFQSMSFTKLVHKSGVLDRVEAEDLGSRIATDNLAWDAETGEALLTRTYNEFKDPVYNLKLPAHLAYRGMQGAYKNIGFETSIGAVSNGVGKLTSSTASNYFMPGDEVLIAGVKAWVLHVNTPSQQLNLIDIHGQLPNISAGKIKIIRSGHRNMPSTAIGTITSMNNPIQGGTLTLNQSLHVLHAEAVEYSENWQSFCGPAIIDENECATDYCFRNDFPINPFVRNVRGEWRPERSWLYLTERNRDPIQPPTASNNSSTNIRDNGWYEKFESFWRKPVSGGTPDQPSTGSPSLLWNRNIVNWIWSARTTQINPNGTELESQNRLGLYSAEILGYYNQLITGVASNSRYRQMAFEGFEDFHYNQNLMKKSCATKCMPPRHFGEGFQGVSTLPNITDETSHSGKYSLKLGGGSVNTIDYTIEENCGNQAVCTGPNCPPRVPFILQNCECIQTFSPDPGKYVLTAWVKEGNGLGKRYYDRHAIKVLTTSGTAVTLKAQGPIIDGWQRVEGEFDIKPTDKFFRLELSALQGATVHFDDIRIFPFNGNMKNYVYDDISLKLLAELDANGYAKFYEYNQAGELIRVKQETENGIMTIQESNYSSPKK